MKAIIRRHIDAMVEETGARADERTRARLTDQIERTLSGTTAKRAKLTEAQRRRIREDYARGDTSLRELAKKYGVHYATIQRTVSQKTPF